MGTTPPELMVVGGVNSGAPLLAPGEVIRNSGKFSKPTKIPGKNYSKDEVVIRNADSGKGELKRYTFTSVNRLPTRPSTGHQIWVDDVNMCMIKQIS